MTTCSDNRKTIVVYGGSFDPIHIGHAALAGIVSRLPGVDGVIILVSPANPLKAGERDASESDRLEMTRLVAANLPNVEASDFEFSLPRPSFTINTLEALRNANPDTDFRLLIGADNWQLFSRWRDAERIISEFGVIIYPRPGYEIESDETLPENVTVLKNIPTFEISSTYIRDEISRGHDVTYLVTPEVARYINERKLYRFPG